MEWIRTKWSSPTVAMIFPPGSTTAAEITGALSGSSMSAASPRTGCVAAAETIRASVVANSGLYIFYALSTFELTVN